MNTQQIVDTLNAALKLDPACISALFGCRRICNQQLTDHPTIQVLDGKEGTHWLRFIGVLNGMLLDAGSTEVVAESYDDDDNQNILKFVTVPYAQVAPK